MILLGEAFGAVPGDGLASGMSNVEGLLLSFPRERSCDPAAEFVMDAGNSVEGGCTAVLTDDSPGDRKASLSDSSAITGTARLTPECEKSSNVGRGDGEVGKGIEGGSGIADFGERGSS